MLVEFVGQSVQDSDNKAINPARLVNCYRERVLQGGRTAHVLQSVLGQNRVSTVGTSAVRAMGRANGVNYVAGDSTLYSMTGDGALTTLSAIADDVNTAIDGNELVTTVSAGGLYYTWDGSLTQPANVAFPNEVASHFTAGRYTMLLSQGRRFQWSGVGNAQSLNALHIADVRANSTLVRGFDIGGDAVLMCDDITEIWRDTGTGNETAFGFVTRWERGLKAHNLATKVDDTLFFVGDDNNVYLGVQNPLDITPPAINTALEENTATHCFYYEDRGHKFCVIAFSDRPAWVYDIKMNEWHERAEGADAGPWRAVAAIEGNTWLAGNNVGEVFSLTRTGKDISAPLRRKMVSLPVFTGEGFIVDSLEIDVKTGVEELNEAVDFALSLGPGVVLKLGTDEALKVGATTADEREGSIQLSTSDDGGNTWTFPESRGLGLKGDYKKRVSWNALGWYEEQAAFCLECDEPGDFQVNSVADLVTA